MLLLKFKGHLPGSKDSTYSVIHQKSFMATAKCVTFSLKSLSMNARCLCVGHWTIDGPTGIFPGLFHNRSLSDTDNSKLVIDQLCACGGWPLVKHSVNTSRSHLGWLLSADPTRGRGLWRLFSPSQWPLCTIEILYTLAYSRLIIQIKQVRVTSSILQRNNRERVLFLG